MIVLVLLGVCMLSVLLLHILSYELCMHTDLYVSELNTSVFFKTYFTFIFQGCILNLIKSVSNVIYNVTKDSHESVLLDFLFICES